MKEIKSKISAHRLVKWRDLEWLQSNNLKDVSPEDMEKITNSLLTNNFIQPFNIWKDKSGKEWILDGRTRKLAMLKLEETGVIIPDKLPANYIECKTRKDAAKLVLVYSSNYAKISSYGLKEYLELNDLLLRDIEKETSFSELDLDLLFGEEKEDQEETDLEMVETQKNLSDIYIVIGEYRILVERDKYLDWMENIKTEVGFDKISVSKEIKRRLQIQ